MSSEIVIVRTGIPTEGFDALAVLGKTFYWTLNLERVQACSEVHIYNWEGNQRIVAPILPEQCYSIDMFGKPKTIIAFDPKAVRFENVDPPRKFGRISASYDHTPPGLNCTPKRPMIMTKTNDPFDYDINEILDAEEMYGCMAAPIEFIEDKLVEKPKSK